MQTNSTNFFANSMQSNSCSRIVKRLQALANLVQALQETLGVPFDKWQLIWLWHLMEAYHKGRNVTSVKARSVKNFEFLWDCQRHLKDSDLKCYRWIRTNSLTQVHGKAHERNCQFLWDRTNNAGKVCGFQMRQCFNSNPLTT